MTSPLPGNTSGTARLLLSAPVFAVGWQERVKVPNPAAGQSFTYTADGRYYERVMALTFQLTTDAVVGNRFVELYLQDTDGTVITSVPASGLVAASTTLNVYLTRDGAGYTVSTTGGSFGKIPDVLIPPGWKWVVTIFNQDANDVVTNAVVLVQRFPNDAAQIPASAHVP